MLDLLPPELILDVLSRLSVFTLRSLRLVSHPWNIFISLNQQAIYRQAAYLHQYTIPDNETLQEAILYHPGSPWRDAVDWQDFCKISLQLQRNWVGGGRAVPRVLSSAGSDTHRFKVDEKQRICIATHMRGGITVSLLFPDVLLWSLPQTHVRPFAHCEYGNGFLVFDRLGSSKEVWRLASDFASNDAVVEAARPDYTQLRAAAQAAQRHGYAGRGHFRPWALLVFPEMTLAYRFVYPTLLSASESRAFLYDVRTGTLMQTIENVVADGDNINYVELSERNLSLPGEFIAGHVSADGRDLVLLRKHGCVIFVQDFENHLDDIESSALEVRIRGHHSQYLAFEEGRVGVATRQGLYVFTLDSFGRREVLSADDREYASFPRISMSGMNPYGLQNDLSCLQITDRRMFFTWNARERAEGIVLYGDPSSDPYNAGEGLMSLEDGNGGGQILLGDEDEDDSEEDDEDEELEGDDEEDIADDEDDFDQPEPFPAMPIHLMIRALQNTVVGCIDMSLMPEAEAGVI
ncbi:hypothetical protein FA95DRAFT_1599422 [Auriscalpium vulgare]|uniref:Uncharacterized protein n=1 Tax=Auriscalpium vulgare TaxID=40419 RepID=A0ACB8R8V1_9AGAM|nr:hypothetical protein FA95DRAFT_1599422 [Auriscalpium vulgare]